jgi:hypothetical protein
MLGSKTIKLASVTAVASLLALPAFVGEANAAVKAFSSLHIENFIASDGGGQLDISDFDVTGINNTSLNSATLTGFAGEVFSDGPNAGDTDGPHACVGNGCGSIPIGENNFSQQSYPPPNSFARGDSRQLGAIITGVPGATQNSVTADTVAGTQLLTTGEQGVGASDVGTDSIVSFALTEDRQVTFSFAARGVLDVIVDDDSGPGSSTGSDFNFSITIRDEAGNTVFSWSPDGQAGGIQGGTENADGADLSQEISRLTPGQTVVDTGLALFSATTGLLNAAVNYTLTISHGSFARAQLDIDVPPVPVPEPASLALFSIGLLAIGGIALRLRRRDG